MSLHPLEPDLSAIQEFGKLETHDHREEAQAAMALYQDICWRAAMVPLTAPAARALAEREAEAASLTRRYMARELEARVFWQQLGTVVAAMDRVLGDGLARAAGAKPAAPPREEVRLTRLDQLPPFVRTAVRDVLSQLAAARRLDPLAVDGLMQELDDLMRFGEDLLREESQAVLRFRGLEERARTAVVSPLLAGPVADQLEVLRGLLRRLDAGNYPLAAFHVDFEKQLLRLDVLLAWHDLVEVHHAD